VSKGFLKSGAPIRLKPDSVTIEAFPEMVSSGDYPDPIPFGRPSENLNVNGFSDHYPISVVVQEM